MFKYSFLQKDRKQESHLDWQSDEVINLSVKPLNYLSYKKNITNLIVNRKFLLFVFIKNKIINLSISFY